MDAELARRLVSDEGRAAIDAATEEADPASLAAATRLRERFAPELAAAAVEQVELRRRAVAKSGDDAGRWFYTRTGLEQATRPAVAQYRAELMRAAGVTDVVDVGCGLGFDSLAMTRAGLRVTAIEKDPATAVLAAANLAGLAEVTEQDAAALPPPGASSTAHFFDPARRSGKGRSWRVEDFSPPWALVTAHLARGAWAKLGPGLPYDLIPHGCRAEWISHRGDLVEVLLRPGEGQAAVLLDVAGAGATDPVVLPVRTVDPVEVTESRDWLAEPDPAIIRAEAVDTLAAELGLTRLAPQIAYLTGDTPTDRPGLTWFRILDELPYRQKILRSWVRDQGVGTLEIKKRGVDIDPAALRRTLRPKGAGTATLILTATPSGARVLVAERRCWHSA